MDALISISGALIAFIGLCAILTSLIHKSPGKTRIVRAISWPGLKPTDRIALPLGGVLACCGILLASIAWDGAPIVFLALVAICGAVSAVMLGIRRSEA